jgi:hypothetical protein
VRCLAQLEAAAAALRGYAEDSRSDLGEVLSPSQVRTFLDCSARWWFKYGLGLPDPPGASFVRGRVVHKMAEFYFRARIEGVEIDLNGLAEPFSWAWDNAIAEASFAPEDDIDALRRQTEAATLTGRGGAGDPPGNGGDAAGGFGWRRGRTRHRRRDRRRGPDH